MRMVLMFACAGIMCLCSCQQKKQPKQPVENIPHTGSVPLIDDGPPLSQITRMVSIGRDSILVTDRNFQLQLFVNYRFQKVLGKKGKGPGEYISIFDFGVDGDSLFLFDIRLGKIIQYSLETNEVVDEIVNADLSQFYGFLRMNGTFYFVFARYTKETEPDKCLLYRLDKQNKLKELNFRYSDLGPDKIVFKYPPMALVLMKAKGGLIYIRFPFSNRMWIYDTVNDTIESFKLDLEYPQQTDLGYLPDLQTQMKASEEIEVVSSFFLLDEQIALWSVRPKFNVLPTRETSRLRFYTYTGKKLTQFNVDPFVWDVEDSLFARWEVDTTQSGDRYPYRITWEKYNIVP
jgi:hypothetical protein